MKLSQITHIAIMAMFVVIVSGVAHAANTCYSGGAVPMSVDISIGGTNFTYNAADMTWTANFDYGDVSGIAVCNDTSGSWGVASPQYDFESGTTGAKCWCKMLSPARSAWVYNGSYNSASQCATSCAYCVNYVSSNADFRGGMFGSVGN